MFGVEKDISPLPNRIEEVERERDALANKVAGLEQQLQGQGVSIDQQQLHIQIRELKSQVEEKERETEALKKALQNAPTPATAVELPGVRPYPPSPIQQYPPNPERPGWGYRGGGGCTGPGSGVGLLNALQGGSVGYEPDGFGPDSGYPQYSGANVPHSDPVYVESVTSPEALDQNMKSKLCPVYKAQGRSVFMTPAKLYGARVDINECGIWFDKGELLEIISKLKGGVLRDLGSLIIGWSHEKGQINDQRNKLVEMRKEYDAGYVRFIELGKIVQTGGPEKDKKITEYRALANDLRQKAAKLREGVDITPGKTVVFPEGKKPGGGHTDLKFCPVALARGQKIIMARVKLMDEDIDVSEHGLWFDPN